MKIHDALTAAAMGTASLFSLFSPRVKKRGVADPQAARSAREAIGLMRVILAPTTGADHSERGIELACRIGAEHGATIHLLYVIVVPRSLPMGAPIPDDETKARAALTRAESIVKSHGMKSDSHVYRARHSGEGIVQRARELKADLLVWGMRPDYGPGDTLLGRTTDFLLRESPCEIILDKMPSEPPP